VKGEEWYLLCCCVYLRDKLKRNREINGLLKNGRFSEAGSRKRRRGGKQVDY
jgi:hypothetical protein